MRSATLILTITNILEVLARGKGKNKKRTTGVTTEIPTIIVTPAEETLEDDEPGKTVEGEATKTLETEKTTETEKLIAETTKSTLQVPDHIPPIRCIEINERPSSPHTEPKHETTTYLNPQICRHPHFLKFCQEPEVEKLYQDLTEEFASHTNIPLEAHLKIQMTELLILNKFCLGIEFDKKFSDPAHGYRREVFEEDILPSLESTRLAAASFKTTLNILRVELTEIPWDAISALAQFYGLSLLRLEQLGSKFEVEMAKLLGTPMPSLEQLAVVACTCSTLLLPTKVNFPNLRIYKFVDNPLVGLNGCVDSAKEKEILAIELPNLEKLILTRETGAYFLEADEIARKFKMKPELSEVRKICCSETCPS